MMTPRQVGLGVASVLLTSVLLTLSLPLGERAYLAWGALVPLLLAFRGRGLLLGFLGGLGTAFFAAWLSASGLLYAHRASGSPVQIYGTYATFAFSFALVLAIWGEPGTRRLSAWWFAALATLLEAVLLFAIPAHLALSQYRQAFWVQAASLGGVWCVSFAIWWTNFALAELAVTRKRNLFLALPLFALPFGNAWLPASGTMRRVAAIQIRHPGSVALLDLHARAGEAGASLVVWPELSGVALAPGGDTAELRSVGGAPFVTSFQDDFKPLPHNVAALFEGGRESVRYAKRKLFGNEAKMHTPGQTAVTVGDVGLNVCFDSCFPSIIRETAVRGAGIVALPTIDPQSSDDFVAAMHAAYSPFRAAESGIAIVRANGGAFSTIVDSRGRIVGERASGDGLLVVDVSVGPRWTLDRRLGDGFLGVCGVGVALGLIAQRRLRHAE